MGFPIVFLIFLLIIQSPQSQSERPLELVTTNSRLPIASSKHVALYDGDDSIFVIQSGLLGFVFKYSIETGRVDTVGNNFHLDGGSAILEGEEITYFGGVFGPGQPVHPILSYSTVTYEWAIIRNSSTPTHSMSLAWDPEGQAVYLFGGADDQMLPLNSVWRYDTRTNELDLAAELAFGRYSAGAAWDGENGVAYVFGGTGAGVEREILKYDPKTSAGYVWQLETRIPIRLPQSCAVYAGVEKHIYMTSENMLLKFDPDTEEILHSERGGRSGPSWEESSKISYVELTTSEPPTTTSAATDDPSPDLRHVLIDASLPFRCRGAATVYDGQDSIYILGGFDGSDMRDEVVKYSLESGIAQIVGTFLPTADGTAFILDQNIIHVGGEFAHSTFTTSNIYNYSTVDHSYDIIAIIPETYFTTRIAVAWDERTRSAFLFVRDIIYIYYPLVGDLLKVSEMEEPVTYSTAVWYRQNELNLVHAFGYGPFSNQYRGIVQFTPPDGNATLTPTILPYTLWTPCVAFAENVGGQIYAFGSSTGATGLVEFDPISEEAEIAVVEGWPHRIHQASCAYVPRMKRMYILGGYRSYGNESFVSTDHISYIQFGCQEGGSTEATTTAPTDSSTTEQEHASPSTTYSSTTESAMNSPEGGSPAALFLSLVVGGPLLALLILICIGFKCYHLRVKKRRSNSEQFGRIVTQFLTEEEVKFFREGNGQTTARAATGNHQQMLAVDDIPYNANYEVAKEDLKIDFGVKLGSGHFGIVYKGSVRHWKSTEPVPVAVKTVRPNAPVEYFKALMSELKILAYVGQHEYVASLIDANTKNIQNGQLFVAVELCKVILLQYLRDQQNGYIEALPMATGAEIGSPEYLKEEPSLPLCRWAEEIAVGMEFLADKHVVHGDLAARNILLSFDLHVKICDFGLARQLADYSYISTHAVNRPWKWMAIESLASLHFSTKSDVWAYGVTLWELFTLGNVPYPCAAWNLDFLNQLVAGYRLEKPGLASQDIYGKMCECWNQKKEDRPTFGELKLFFMDELNRDT